MFKEADDLMVALDVLAGQHFLSLGDMELFGLAVGDASEDEGGMFLAALALAVRFAAGQGTHAWRGSEKLLPRDERLKPGAAFPLGFGHSGRVHGQPPVLYYYNI